MQGPSRNSQASYSNPFETPGLSGAAGAGAGAGVGAGYAAGVPQMSERGMAYQNVPSESYWPETSTSPPIDYAAQDAKARRSRLLKWGGIIFAVLAIIAIVVGVTVSQVTKNNGNSGSGSGSSNSGNNGGTSTTNGTSTNGDASQFDKDSRLHQSFWALAYTPEGAILPNCNVNQANVTRDIQVSRVNTTGTKAQR